MGKDTMSHVKEKLAHGAEVLAAKAQGLLHKVEDKLHLHQDTGPDPHAEQNNYGFEAARDSALGMPIDRH